MKTVIFEYIYYKKKFLLMSLVQRTIGLILTVYQEIAISARLKHMFRLQPPDRVYKKRRV